jgi:NAD+ diphosphatase
MNPGFTGSPLDRADRVRNDAEAYGALLGDWRARILGLDGLDPLLASEGGLLWHSIAELTGSEELILLGLSDGKPHFVPLVEADGGMFRSPAIWRALTMLPAEDAAIYGTARSLIEWHNGHRFCGKCGHLTEMFRAGWGRKCGNCGKEHFPRTDPVIPHLRVFWSPGKASKKRYAAKSMRKQGSPVVRCAMSPASHGPLAARN